MNLKKIFIKISLFLISFVITFSLISPSKIYAESISKFDVKLETLPTGEINVVEKIQYDFEASEKHGIIRNIPYTKVNNDNKKFMMEIKEINVTDETGLPYRFEVNTSSDQKDIKIGDPDSLVRGVKTYVITYRVSGAITYFENFDEIYWNSIGTSWSVPIKSANVEIILPEQVKSELIKATCYSGIKGSTNSECQSTVVNFKDLNDRNILKTKINFLTLRALNANEGLTTVVDFPKNIVAVLEPTPYRTPASVIFWMVLWGIIGVLWYVLYPFKAVISYIKYRNFAKPKERILTADYEAPKVKGEELSPAQTGMLSDKTIGKEDLTATLIDLARRGFFKIKVEERKDWNPFNSPEKVSFIKTTSQDSTQSRLQNFEQILYSQMFKDGNEIDSEALGKSFATNSTISLFEKSISKSLKSKGLSENDLVSTRDFYTGIGVFAVVTGNIILALFSFVYGRFFLKFTEDGIDAYSKAESLKNFLVGQDRQLNFQSKYQYWFEKLLPYATSFKVEKVWMDRFKDLNIKTPDWISTNDPNLSTFSFINTINNSIGTVHAATNNSSSGFSSGSSGGFSGGGGGGGGGSSW